MIVIFNCDTELYVKIMAAQNLHLSADIFQAAANECDTIWAYQKINCNTHYCY